MAAPPPYSQIGAPQGYQTGQTTVVANAPVPGYVPGYQTAALPGYQPTAAQATATAYVIYLWKLPACQTGNLKDEFTPLGICLAFCFFPIGVLCCLKKVEREAIVSLSPAVNSD